MAVRARTARERQAAPRLSLVPAPRRRPAPGLVLTLIYAVAVSYHWLQSRGHVTPAVFGDELLYSKLAQSVAAGHGFVLRGETIFFPAPLSILAQAPAWLIHSTPAAFAVGKAINVAIMSSAVFPAYFLARRLVRTEYALLAAAAAVAGPAMVYGPYLMSEALAYPVFLLALATMVRAIEQPSRRMEAAVVAVSAAAVLTRVQFVVVPVAYLVAASLAGRLCGERVVRSVRRHALSLGTLLGVAALTVVTGGIVLGTYLGATTLDLDPVGVLRWSAFTAALLPFVAGWLVIPGALLGIGLLCVRPRDRVEAAFGLLALASVVLVLLEAGAIGAGEANRSLERYAIYAIPLAAIAFFTYVERGAPYRRLYVSLSLCGSATAWLIAFPADAGHTFAFDTPTFSVYAQTAAWLGDDDAATIFAAVPFVAGITLALLPLRRRLVPTAVGAATIALLLVTGAVAYAGDHAMTRGTLAARAADPPDWLDRSRLGRADYLQLPDGSPHFGWLLETWNGNFGRPIELEQKSPDGYPTGTAHIGRDGRLLVDGGLRRTLVVNDYGTAIELDGQVVSRPRDGLTAYRLPAAPRIRLLGRGIFFDRWAQAVVHVRVWPKDRSTHGAYRVVVLLPTGLEARNLALQAGATRRTVRLEPGQKRVVRLPVSGLQIPPLTIRTDQADALDAGTPDARLVAVRIPSIKYLSSPKT